MVTATVAEVTDTRITVIGGGRQVAVYRAKGDELEGGPKTHGINLEEADHQLERMGWVAGTFRWQESGGYYKTVVVSRNHPRFAAAREQGEANERAVRLEIARTGRRPSGKPLTPEMRRWVEEYKAGKRDF